MTNKDRGSHRPYSDYAELLRLRGKRTRDLHIEDHAAFLRDPPRGLFPAMNFDENHEAFLGLRGHLFERYLFADGDIVGAPLGPGEAKP